MIDRYVKGDAIELYIDGAVQGFAHGCNIFNTMGAGIAAQVKDKIPYLHTIDQATEKGQREKLGTCTYFYGYQDKEDGSEPEAFAAFNLYTQATFWDESDMLDYNAVASAFTEMNNICAEVGVKTVAIPKIGAGLAKGDWNRISKIIDQVTVDLEIVVVEYEEKA